MDTSSGKYKPYYGTALGPFVAVSHCIQSHVRRVIKFFVLTIEERLKAGIFFGGQGRSG